MQKRTRNPLLQSVVRTLELLANRYSLHTHQAIPAITQYNSTYDIQCCFVTQAEVPVAPKMTTSTTPELDMGQ